MAPEKKRVNKRKSRTVEVSSASSSSESESDSSASSIAAPEPEVKKQKKTKAKSKTVASKGESSTTENISIPERSLAKDSDKAFEEFYLRQAAQEFANDLDKLRSAGDFSAKSVPMLIAALRQGGACFGAEEKARIVGGVEG